MTGSLGARAVPRGRVALAGVGATFRSLHHHLRMRHLNMHSWRRLALASLGCLVAATPVRSRRPHAAGMREEIAIMMDGSARAWTRGDLDRFMADYLDAPRTTYVTHDRLLRGRRAIHDHYAPRFAPGAQHDSLTFERMEVDSLAPNVANVIAWYVLHRGDSVVARGPTTVVMLRVHGRWQIVHDHSS